jgi:hypothetical protein
MRMTQLFTSAPIRLLALAVFVLVTQTGCYGGYGRYGGGGVGGTTFINTYTQTVPTYAGDPSQEVATFAFTQQLTSLMSTGALVGSNVTVLVTNVSSDPEIPLCFSYNATVTLNFQQYSFKGSVNNLPSGHSVEQQVSTNPLRIDLAQINIVFRSDSQSIPGTAVCK